MRQRDGGHCRNWLPALPFVLCVVWDEVTYVAGRRKHVPSANPLPKLVPVSDDADRAWQVGLAPLVNVAEVLVFRDAARLAAACVSPRRVDAERLTRCFVSVGGTLGLLVRVADLLPRIVPASDAAKRRRVSRVLTAVHYPILGVAVLVSLVEHLRRGQALTRGQALLVAAPSYVAAVAFRSLLLR